MNLEPYMPALTAALTLVNTIILVWNQRHVREIRKNVNGMKLQLLAEAERRGRRQALHPELEATEVSHSIEHPVAEDPA